MAAISSAADGTWIAGAATTWVGGVAPGEGDTATILNTHDVEIDGNITIGADSATAAIQVNSGGSLFVPSTVAGNYTLTLKGDLKTDGTGGTISFGTAANPIPNTRTFTVLTNYSASLADGKYGIIIAAGGTFNCQGADRWANGLTDPDRTLLAADAAINATSLTVADSTKWIDNDLIAIAATTLTTTQCELGAMAATTVNTTLTVDGFGGAGGGLAYAHSGTSPTQAELINLTRNVKITAYSSTSVGYVQLATSSVSDVDWTEFSYMGENAANKKGINIQTTTGSCNFNRCSFYNFEDFGIYCEGSAVNNFTINASVCWNLTSVNTSNQYGLLIDTTSGTSWTINNVLMIYIPNSGVGFRIKDLGGTFTYNTCIGCSTNAFQISEVVEEITGSFSYLTAHSNNTNFYLGQLFGTMSNITGWHSGGTGLSVIFSSKMIINGMTLFGNTTNSINITYSYAALSNVVSNGTTTRSTATGLYVGGSIVELYDCNFSTTGGIKTAHTNDIYAGASNSKSPVLVKAYNTKMGASTPVNLQYATYGSCVQSHDHGQVAGTHKTWKVDETGYGVYYTLEKDTSYYHTASPSIKITPASATYKQTSNIIQIPVASGNNPTISVYFRKSASYNGNQPRLRVRRNESMGITVDTTLATSAAAVDVDVAPGTFTQLSGQPGAVSADGVLECYVDCDGTAGYINVCDWAVTGAKTQADNLDAFYLWGLPFPGLLSASAAAGGGGNSIIGSGIIIKGR